MGGSDVREPLSPGLMEAKGARQACAALRWAPEGATSQRSERATQNRPRPIKEAPVSLAFVGRLQVCPARRAELRRRDPDGSEEPQGGRSLLSA